MNVRKRPVNLINKQFRISRELCKIFNKKYTAVGIIQKDLFNNFTDEIIKLLQNL